jgi:hypothetical protein
LTIYDTNFIDNDMVFNNTLVRRDHLHVVRWKLLVFRLEKILTCLVVLQSTTNSFIVETLGPLTMERTCFQNNAVGVSNVVVFGNAFTNTDNFINNSTGPLCAFTSVFENLQQFDAFTPTCSDAGASSCVAGLTSAPSSAPSMVPTPMASGAPSVGPTGQASESPTGPPPTISPAPTTGAQNTPAPNGFDFPSPPPGSSDASSCLGQTLFGIISGLTVALMLR